MKETGVIRRIDELGRIVIPKEIRKRLHVKSGDNLDIFINNDEIVLKKYDTLNQFDTLLSNLIKAIKEENIDYIITSSSDVIFQTLNKKLEDSKVSDDFMKMFLKNKDLEISKDIRVSITKDLVLKNYVLAKRVYFNGDLYAIVILVSSSPLMKKDRDYVNIIYRYIKNYLEETN